MDLDYFICIEMNVTIHSRDLYVPLSNIVN